MADRETGLASLRCSFAAGVGITVALHFGVQLVLFVAIFSIMPKAQGNLVPFGRNQRAALTAS